MSTVAKSSFSRREDLLDCKLKPRSEADLMEKELAAVRTALNSVDDALLYLSGVFLGLGTGRTADKCGMTVEEYMTSDADLPQVGHPEDSALDCIQELMRVVIQLFGQMQTRLESLPAVNA